MKKLLLIPFLAFPLMAQDNILVKFYDGADTNKPPAGYPSATELTGRTDTPARWETNMTVVQYDSLQPGWDLEFLQWRSNLNWAVIIDPLTNRVTIGSDVHDVVNDIISTNRDIGAYINGLSDADWDRLNKDLTISALEDAQQDDILSGGRSSSDSADAGLSFLFLGALAMGIAAGGFFAQRKLRKKT